jgi:hypothetical protein
MGVQPITIPQSLAYVLNNAGDKSNVDFNYLVETAQRESSMNPSATTPSSSAVGLFQFLDTTWLQVMKEEGPRLGYQKYADAITQDKDGNYTIKDKALRAQVLKLREDPQVAADMAAAFTESNGQYLESKFGRMPSPGELYIAHFLGPQGAEKMFDAGLKNPDQVAATLFPSAAKANPQIFYDGKHARTIREVYKALVATHNAIEGAPLPAVDPAFATQQLAGTGATPGGPTDATNPAAVPAITPKDMSFMALFANGQMPPPGTPLVGAEAAAPIAAAQPVIASAAPATEPLAAIDAATAAPAPTVGDPLPAPAPLVAPLALAEAPNAADPSTAPAAAAAAVQAAAPPTVLVATAPDAVPTAPPAPKARVELSPGVMPNPAFFTQLLWQDGDGP